MDIYKHKDYTYNTTKLLFDKPCIIDGLGEIYPVKIIQHDEFTKYANLLMFSRKYLELKDNISLLSGVILTNAYSKCKDVNDFMELSLNILTSLDDMCKLIEMVTHKKIIYIKENDIKYIFKDVEGEHVLINDDNFDIFREVILKMNLLKEPKVFEDKLTQKWYQKALLGKQKNAPKITFDDIILTVSQDMKIAIKDMEDLNIFQLYSHYYRTTHVWAYETVSKFRCVGSVKSDIQYADGIIENMYKEESLDDVTISADSLGKML